MRRYRRRLDRLPRRPAALSAASGRTRRCRRRAPDVPQRPRHEPRLQSLDRRRARRLPQRSRYRQRAMATASPPPGARRLARTRGGRGPERRASSARSAGRRGDRARDEGRRLPQRQGPAAGRAPAGGPRGVLDEAVRRGLPGWYEEAVSEAGVATVGDPQVDMATCPRRAPRSPSRSRSGSCPRPSSATTTGVEVGRREPAVDPDEVQAELERLRESLASLETVSARRASGDFVVIDFPGTSTASRSRAARPAASCSSSDRAGWSRASRSSSRAPRRRRAQRGRHLPRRLPGEHLAGQDAVRGHGQGGQGEAPAGAGRRLRRRGRRLRLARRAARGDRGAHPPRPTSAPSSASSARPPWTRWWRGRDGDPPRAGALQGPRDVAPHLPSAAARASTRSSTWR